MATSGRSSSCHPVAETGDPGPRSSSADVTRAPVAGTPDPGPDTPAAMWAAYAQASGASGPWQSGGFADELPAVATELAALVLRGPKRATTSRADDFDVGGEPRPAEGDHWVVTDGRGRAVCITRTTRVETRRFGDIDEAYAWDEGEDDRTLASWRDGHIRYFASIGRPVEEDTTMILEWFEVVWPPEATDR